ncbi:MAG TPA: multidrug efflux SMR transporter [Phnomibacter sp.]|nr:multidrug efflux SMR transporter [Phnomibacter sp.]
MAWIYLLLAAACEIGFASTLKLTNNFKHLGYTVVFVICYIASILLLNQAIKTIPVGTAYAVWTGIGAAGTVLIGILYFKEPADFWRIFFLGLLVLSIAGLKWASGAAKGEA